MDLRRCLLAGTVVLALAACSNGTDAEPPGPAASRTPSEPGVGTAMSEAPQGAPAAAGTTGAGTGTEAAQTEPAAGADGGASCLDAAQQIVDAAKEPLTVGALDPVDMSAAAGATIWHIAPSLATGYALELSEGVEQAGAAAGLAVTVFDAQGQPNVMAEGVSQAVANGADAIIIHAIAPEVISDPLADAEAAGIPVLSVLNALDPAALPEGVTAVLDPDVTGLAEQMAAYALVDGGCESEAVVFYASVFPILDQMNAQIQESYSSLCPECGISELNLDLRTMSQELPSQTQNVLRSTPGVTHAIATFDSAALFIIQGIDELGADVSVVGANGNTANLDVLRQGGAQVADAAYPPGAFVGWQVIDQVGRLLEGQDVPAAELPVQMIDASNVGESNDLAQVFPALVGFEDDFIAAWGL